MTFRSKLKLKNLSAGKQNKINVLVNEILKCLINHKKKPWEIKFFGRNAAHKGIKVMFYNFWDCK